MSSVSRRDAVLTAQAPPPGNSRSPSAAVCRDPHGPLHPPHAQPVAARRAAQSGAQLDERADSAAIKAARVSGISGLPNSRAHPGADWPGDAMRAPGPGPARSTAGQAGPPSAVRPSVAKAEGGFSTLRRPETGSDSATAASAENARSGAPAAEKACGGGTRTAGGDFARGPMSQPCAPDVAAASPGDSASDTRGSVPSESAAPHDLQGEAARGPPALATSPHRGLISKAGESNSAAQVAGAGPVAANARRGRSPALQVSVSPAGQGGIEAAAVSRAAPSSGPEHKPQAAPGKDPRAGGSARATAQRSSGLQTDPAREHLKQETAVTSALGVAPGAPWGAALAVPAPPTVDPRQHPDPQATLVARGDPRRLQPAGRSSLLHGLAVAASAAGASPAFLAGRGQDDAETPATVQRAGTAPTPAAQAATAGANGFFREPSYEARAAMASQHSQMAASSHFRAMQQQQQQQQQQQHHHHQQPHHFAGAPGAAFSSFGGGFSPSQHMLHPSQFGQHPQPLQQPQHFRAPRAPGTDEDTWQSVAPHMMFAPPPADLHAHRPQPHLSHGGSDTRGLSMPDAHFFHQHQHHQHQFAHDQQQAHYQQQQAQAHYQQHQQHQQHQHQQAQMYHMLAPGRGVMVSTPEGWVEMFPRHSGSLTAHPDLAPTSRLDHPGRSFVLGGSWPHTAEAPGPDFALGGSYHPAAAGRAAEAAQPWATAARSGGEAGGHLAPKAHHSDHADDAEARHGGPGASSRSVPAATPAASGKPASDARAESHGATPGSGRHSVSDEDRGAPVDPDALNGTPQTPSELLTQAREAARMRLLHAGFDATTCERIRHHCTREGGFTDPTAFRGSTDAKKRAARSRFRGVFPDGNGRAGFRVHLRLPRALASAARSPQYCFLGRFNTEVEAALVYNAAVRLSGALFKRLNVVPDEDIDALLATGRASCVPATRGRFPSSPPMRYVAPSEAAAQAARPGFAAGGWEAGPGVSARAAAAVPARRRQRKRSRDSSETSSDASADGRHDSGRHSSDEEWTSGGRQAKSARGAAQQAAPGAARAQQRASAPRSARGRGGLEVVTDASSLLPMVPAASTPFGHLAFQPGMLPSPAVQVPSLPVSAAGAFAGQFHAHASANFLPPFSHELAPASGPPAAHTWATAASSGAPATSSSASAAEDGPASSPGTGLGAAASGARGRGAAGDAPWQVPSSTSA